MTPPNGSDMAIRAANLTRKTAPSRLFFFFLKLHKCQKPLPLVITFECKLKDLFVHASGMPISVSQLSPGKH